MHAILQGGEQVFGEHGGQAGSHEAQRRAEEAGALPMTGLRVMPPPEGENDAGARFTDDPGRDSQRHGSRFLCGCCGYAWCCPVGGDAPDAPTGTGATPQSEGLVRAWGQVCFHTLGPALQGVAPVPMIPGGKATGQAR